MARKNRPTAEIPNGSMADIAFLLLIFFLVTTTIANDKGIAMLLPPKPDPNQPPPEVTKNDRNIFKILANSQDKLLVEDEPLTDVFELREMVKSFILNFGNPGEEGVAIYNSLHLQIYFLERCRSGRTGLPAKELYAYAYRGFESLPLRKRKFIFIISINLDITIIAK